MTLVERRPFVGTFYRLRSIHARQGVVRVRDLDCIENYFKDATIAKNTSTLDQYTREFTHKYFYKYKMFANKCNSFHFYCSACYCSNSLLMCYVFNTAMIFYSNTQLLLLAGVQANLFRASYAGQPSLRSCRGQWLIVTGHMLNDTSYEYNVPTMSNTGTASFSPLSIHKK